jgi:hypothetical protein
MQISFNNKILQFKTSQRIRPEIMQKVYYLSVGIFLSVMICVGVMFPSISHSAQEDQYKSVDSVIGSGILDGLSFTSTNGQYGKPGDHGDTLIFKDGTFVSTDCEKKCNYPAQAYFARRLGEIIEFISETRCLTQDAEIVWRGTVDGNAIEGTYSWRSSRWYWTIEKEFWFKGSLQKNLVHIDERK